jgi:hypothetical protein
MNAERRKQQGVHERRVAPASGGVDVDSAFEQRYEHVEVALLQAPWSDDG